MSSGLSMQELYMQKLARLKRARKLPPAEALAEVQAVMQEAVKDGGVDPTKADVVALARDLADIAGSAAARATPKRGKKD